MPDPLPREAICLLDVTSANCGLILKRGLYKIEISGHLKQHIVGRGVLDGKDPLQTDPQQAEDPGPGALAGGTECLGVSPGHKQTGRIYFCGAAPAVDLAAPGGAGAAGSGFPTLTEAKLKALAERAGGNIPERVWYYVLKVWVDYGSITIRCQKSRSGGAAVPGKGTSASTVSRC